MRAEGRSFEVSCTVRVAHTEHELSAHVELDGDVQLAPGDSVKVHGAPIQPGWGDVVVEHRQATVTRARRWERLWLKVRGHLECASLLEVHFSDERVL